MIYYAKKSLCHHIAASHDKQDAYDDIDRDLFAKEEPCSQDAKHIGKR